MAASGTPAAADRGRSRSAAPGATPCRRRGRSVMKSPAPRRCGARPSPNMHAAERCEVELAGCPRMARAAARPAPRTARDSRPRRMPSQACVDGRDGRRLVDRDDADPAGGVHGRQRVLDRGACLAELGAGGRSNCWPSCDAGRRAAVDDRAVSPDAEAGRAATVSCAPTIRSARSARRPARPATGRSATARCSGGESGGAGCARARAGRATTSTRRRRPTMTA